MGLREELDRLLAQDAENRHRIRVLQRTLDRIAEDRETLVTNRTLGLG